MCRRADKELEPSSIFINEAASEEEEEEEEEEETGTVYRLIFKLNGLDFVQTFIRVVTLEVQEEESNPESRKIEISFRVEFCITPTEPIASELLPMILDLSNIIINEIEKKRLQIFKNEGKKITR